MIGQVWKQAEVVTVPPANTKRERSTEYIELGIKDLEKAKNRWENLIDGIITSRNPYTDFLKVIDLRSPDNIKTEISWI